MRSFINDETGPTAVEYAVLIALIATVALIAITAFGETCQEMINSIEGTLDDAMGASGL